MKDLLLTFIFALIVTSFMNGYNASGPAPTQAASSAATSLPLVSQSNFTNEVLNSPTPVLVDFYTDSSVQCQNMAPVLQQLSSEYQGSLKLVRVDVTANPDLADQYQVTALPMFIIFKNGAKVESCAGEMAKGDLEALLKKYLSTADARSMPAEG